LGGELKLALQGPDQVITDIYMNMDGLEDHPRFGQMLEQATACQAKLDALKQGAPTREAIAKARALNDEANRVRRAFDEAKMTR
jgi:23S rRNA U2552 (ribose-2'-O)-methylase RlmE/FtsJ